MIDIDISLDVREVEKYLVDTVQKQQLPKATASALNKVAVAVQNKAVRLIAEDIGFTSVYGKRKGDLKVKRLLVRYRATWTNLGASIKPNNLKKVLVSDLNPVQVKTGIVYTGRGGKKSHIPGAFKVKFSNGHEGVYKRKGKKRFPIIALKTVSIPEVFIKKVIEQAMQEVAKERWGTIFPREVNYYLNK